MTLDRIKLDAACAKADALSRRFAARSDVAEQQRQIRKKVVPNVTKTLAKRGDIDPASLALAMHLKHATPQLRHQPHAEAHLGHKPPRRLPRPSPEGRGERGTSGSRKLWSKPRVDADDNISIWPRVKLLRQLEKCDKESSAINQKLIDAGHGYTKPNEMKQHISENPLFQTYWDCAERHRKLIDEKEHRLRYHGNLNPVKKSKWADSQSRGDGLSVAAALIAFLATASISTLVTWGIDKIEEAKSLVRIAATGKLAPKDVAQIRKAMDKLRAAQKAAQEKRRPQAQLRYEPRFDRGDVNFKVLGKRGDVDEKIVGAAVKLGGKVYTANSHLQAYNKACKELGESQAEQLLSGGDPRFFVTNTGRLVTAKEAKGIENQSGFHGASNKTRSDADYFGLVGHVHPLTGHIFGVTKPVVDLTTTGVATGTTMGGGFGVAGTAVTALAFLIAAASLGYLVKKGADWLRQKLDLLRLAKSGGKINARDRVEIMAAIEKIKLAKYRAEGLKRGDAEDWRTIVERQRELEGMKATIRDPQTGKIYTGWSHRGIFDSMKDREIANRLYHEWDRGTDETGFVDNSGKFYSRTEADRRWKVLTMEDLKDKRRRNDAQARGDFWKKPETGTALAKPQQSSPTEIGAFLSKAQQTKPSAAPSSPAGPAATAVAPSPAVAASTAPTRAEKPQTARQQWRASKPLKPFVRGPTEIAGFDLGRESQVEKAAQRAGLLARRAERAKHPKDKAEYREQKKQWKEAGKQQRRHERAYNAFETETPPPGSAEAKLAETKKAAQLQQRQRATEATARNAEIKKQGQAATAEAGKLKRHQKQYLAYERNDPPPGSGAYRRHHQKFGTLPQQPGEARPVAAG